MARNKKTLLERIQKFEQVTETGCWIWTGKLHKEGYGVVCDESNKPMLAHRASWMLFRSDIPDGMIVCHKCDTPSCINPSHLFLGTDADNNKDMMSKKRNAQPKGSRTANSKINESIAIEIFNARGTLKEIASKYGLFFSTVHKIKSKESWKHIHTGDM